MNENYYYQNAGGIYVDNALNRRLGRVGQAYGKKSNTKKPKPSKDNKSPKGNKPKPPKSNKSIKEIYHLSFSCNILVFDKLRDDGFKISSLDKSKKPNKEINKYINFNKLVDWHKRQIQIEVLIYQLIKSRVTINDVKKKVKE